MLVKNGNKYFSYPALILDRHFLLPMDRSRCHKNLPLGAVLALDYVHRFMFFAHFFHLGRSLMMLPVKWPPRFRVFTHSPDLTCFEKSGRHLRGSPNSVSWTKSSSQIRRAFFHPSPPSVHHPQLGELLFFTHHHSFVPSSHIFYNIAVRRKS